MIQTFEIFQPFEADLLAGYTTTEEGHFTYALEEASIPDAAYLNQTHSDTIYVLDEPPRETADGDALITQKRGLPIAVRVADCQGLIIYDPTTKTAAAVHSGWRGCAKNIAGKTIRKMKKELGVDPENCLVGISPSIQKCCAEFSDPYNELPAFMHKFIDGTHVDLAGSTLEMLKLEGVPENQIEISSICTLDDPNYYSYRGGNEQERFAVFTSLK